jgi:hypothetical protein
MKNPAKRQMFPARIVLPVFVGCLFVSPASDELSADQLHRISHFVSPLV